MSLTIEDRTHVVELEHFNGYITSTPLVRGRCSCGWTSCGYSDSPNGHRLAASYTVKHSYRNGGTIAGLGSPDEAVKP